VYVFLIDCRQKLTISHLQAQLTELETRSTLQLSATLHREGGSAVHVRLKVTFIVILLQLLLFMIWCTCLSNSLFGFHSLLNISKVLILHTHTQLKRIFVCSIVLLLFITIKVDY